MKKLNSAREARVYDMCYNKQREISDLRGNTFSSV